MKQNLLLIICFIFYGVLISDKGFTQSIDSLPPGFFYGSPSTLLYDSTNNLLYAGGRFNELYGGGPMSCISKWNGTQWDSLGSGVNDGGRVNKMVIYQNQLIAAGTFGSIGGIPAKGLAKWTGSTWQPFADVMKSSGTQGIVVTLYIDGTDLYVGGEFDSINGIAARSIARYDGTNWYTYPSFFLNYVHIDAIITYNNELYIGGNFDGGPNLKDIRKFDGTNWVAVGNGLSGANTFVTGFAIYQNLLYVSGYFLTIYGDPGNNIAIWDGNSWSQAGQGVMPANPLDIEVFNNKLYAAGQFNDASGIPVTYIAVWDGNTWSSFDGHIFDLGVAGFAAYQNTLYLAGVFTTVDGVPMRHVIRYDLFTGISESLDNCVKIYPTISDGLYTIDLTCSSEYNEIELYNNLGQCVYQKRIIDFERFTLDLTSFPSGFYNIICYDEKSKYINKLMKY